MAYTPRLAIVRPPLPVPRGHRALQRPRGLSVCSRRRSSSCTRLQAKDARLRATPRALTTVSAREQSVVRCHSPYVSRHRYPYVLRGGADRSCVQLSTAHATRPASSRGLARAHGVASLRRGLRAVSSYSGCVSVAHRSVVHRVQYRDFDIFVPRGSISMQSPANVRISI